VGWSPLDTWGRPAYIGAPLYAGYYDPGCWTFVGYNHFHSGNVHRYAVPIGTVGDDLHHATVVARAPRVDPQRIAESPQWRARAQQMVADDHAARMRPIQGSRLPDRRLSDIQNQLMRRPVASPISRRSDETLVAPSIEPRTTPSRSRRVFDDPRAGGPGIRRDVRPQTEDGVRELYQRMSRPHETRRQDAPSREMTSPHETPGYLPRQRVAPDVTRPAVPRNDPRVEVPREFPRMQQPRGPEAPSREHGYIPRQRESYLPRQPWRVAPDVTRPAVPRNDPRVEVPHEIPRMQQPRPAPEAPRVEMPGANRPQPRAQAPQPQAPRAQQGQAPRGRPQARPKHGDRH
jgi:hypothetical protein